MKHNEPIYRIGFFGRSNAGKTSLLVALSEMTEHVVVEDHSWTISYLPPVEGQFTDKGLFEKLKRGERLLNEAKDSINRTHKPPPTDEKEKTTLYRFQLATGGSTRTVELWDYAGEILDPSRLDNIESHGYELGKRIADCDAVLVLAPASDDSNESKVDAERSSQISQSLSQLDSWIRDNDELSEVRRRPVALIVTKSDRANQSHNSTMEQLGEPAAKVWRKIQALIGSEVTRWFALSTSQNNANSSDLLSPLVWAMNAVDKEVIALAQRVEQRGVMGWSAKKQAIAQLNKLVFRRPPTIDVKDPINQQANEANDLLCGSLRLYRYASAVAVGLFLWLLLCGADRLLWTRGFERIANDPSASVEDLKASEQYFSAYDSVLRTVSPFRLESKKATALHDASRELRAKRQWELVTSEVDPIKKGELAESYGNEFPEKRGLEHVIDTIRKAGEEAALRRYSNWFEPLRIRKEREDLTLDERSILIDELAEMPRDLTESKDQAEDRNSIVDQLRKDQSKANTTVKRKVFVEQLENLIQRKRPFEALSALKDKPDSLDWPEMASTLLLMRNNWQDDIAAYLSRLRQEKQYEKAIQTTQIAKRDREVIPASVGLPDEPDLKQLINDLQGEWDKTEYNNFRANPSIQLANEYRRSTHSKCMLQTVQNWVEWKESESSARSLRPQLVSITWDKVLGAWNPMIDFYVNGQQIMDKQLAGEGTVGETKKFAETQRSLEFEADKPIECRIVLWDNNWSWWDWHIGEFSGTYKMSDLIQTEGKTDFLRAGKATHTFRIRLVGMDKAPELLEWQPCK